MKPLRRQVYNSHWDIVHQHIEQMFASRNGILYIVNDGMEKGIEPRVIYQVRNSIIQTLGINLGVLRGVFTDHNETA